MARLKAFRYLMSSADLRGISKTNSFGTDHRHNARGHTGLLRRNHATTRGRLRTAGLYAQTLFYGTGKLQCTVTNTCSRTGRPRTKSPFKPGAHCFTSHRHGSIRNRRLHFPLPEPKRLRARRWHFSSRLALPGAPHPTPQSDFRYCTLCFPLPLRHSGDLPGTRFRASSRG